jgi:hypothetical protein
MTTFIVLAIVGLATHELLVPALLGARARLRAGSWRIGGPAS